MFEILKNNLYDDSYDNHIYFGLKNEEINELIDLLKNDYNCLDIIIDFNDVNKLNGLINDIPDTMNKKLIKKYIYEYYIYYKMLSVVEEDIELKKILFGSNINDFRDYEFIMFSSVLKKLEEKAKKKRIRLHVFVDNINDVLLQQEINDLIYMRIPIAIRCYTTNEKLITFATSNGSVIESPHDYSGFYTKEFNQKIRQKNLFY